MLSVRLTLGADLDIEEIAAYTLDRFGTQQAADYRDGLLGAIQLLPEHPEIGSDQQDIRPGTRRLVHESHSIYYEIADEEIVVLRILGPGEDPLSEFQDA